MSIESERAKKLAQHSTFLKVSKSHRSLVQCPTTSLQSKDSREVRTNVCLIYPLKTHQAKRAVKRLFSKLDFSIWLKVIDLCLWEVLRRLMTFQKLRKDMKEKLKLSLGHQRTCMRIAVLTLLPSRTTTNRTIISKIKIRTVQTISAQEKIYVNIIFCCKARCLT